MNATRIAAALSLALLGPVSVSAQPQVSLERLIGTGDPLPNGYTFLSTSFAVFDLDGTHICFPVSTANQGDAICRMNLATREITVVADMSTINPTVGLPFTGYLNPSIANGDVYFPGRTGGNHPTGIYAGEGGPARAVADILDAGVLIPRAVETDGDWLVFRDTGYAGEALAYVPAAGGAQPRYFAYRDRPAPGGGQLFNIEEVFGVSGDRIVFSALRSAGASGYGIYQWSPEGPDTLTTLVETGDAVPDGHVLSLVRDPTPSGQRTAFVGTDAGFPYFDGVYIHNPDGSLETVVDDNTPFPGRNVTFDSFNSLAIDGSNVMFSGLYGEATYFGAFVRYNGDLLKIVEGGEIVNGGVVMSISHRWRALHGNKAVVALTMEGFSSFGLYLATITGACPADFNADGQVNTLDVLAFLNAWSAGEPAADFNADGQINTLDVLAFLNAWSAGC
jgi:hypothetical protein